MNAAPDQAPVESVPYQKPTLWMRLRGNASVLVGGWILIVFVVVSIAAPVLGTVDPILIDASNRDLLPGEEGDVTDLEGNIGKHTFWMGADSFGRDIYSRVLYGTRVSLLVGFSVVFGAGR